MCKSNWTLLILTILAGAIGFGGYAVTYAWFWKSAFALLIVLSLVSFLYQYRSECSG